MRRFTRSARRPSPHSFAQQCRSTARPPASSSPHPGRSSTEFGDALTIHHPGPPSTALTAALRRASSRGKSPPAVRRSLSTGGGRPLAPAESQSRFAFAATAASLGDGGLARERGQGSALRGFSGRRRCRGWRKSCALGVGGGRGQAEHVRATANRVPMMTCCTSHPLQSQRFFGARAFLCSGSVIRRPVSR